MGLIKLNLFAKELELTSRKEYGFMLIFGDEKPPLVLISVSEWKGGEVYMHFLGTYGSAG